jgi:hypothetical protein
MKVFDTEQIIVQPNFRNDIFDKVKTPGDDFRGLESGLFRLDY